MRDYVIEKHRRNNGDDHLTFVHAIIIIIIMQMDYLDSRGARLPRDE